MSDVVNSVASVLRPVLETLEGVSPVQAVAALVAAYAALCLWQLTLIGDRLKYRHIPGPPPTPALGNLWTVGPVHKQLTFKAYTQWRGQYGKIFKWFCGQHPMVVCADAEMVRLIAVKHFRVFHDRKFIYAPQPYATQATHMSGLPFIRGSNWASIKNAMMPLVASEGLAAAAKITDDALDKALALLDAAAKKGGSVDMRMVSASLTLRVITAASFGVNIDTITDDPERMVANNQLVASADKALQASLSALWTTIVPVALRPLVYPVLSALPSKQLKRLHTHRARLFGAAMVIAKNAFKRMGSEFKDEIGMTKAFTRPDTKEILDLYADKEPIPGSVIDLLVRARNKQTGEPFKTHQIVAQANTVMVGGHDTTGFTLTAALFFLATNPEAQAKLLREIDAFGRDRVVTRADLPDLKYMNACLSETIRLLPAVWVTTREATEDITVNGVYMPKGTVVHLDLYGLHRDPEQFPDPLAFRPERFYDAESDEAKGRHQYAYCGFGAGPRLCLGYKLATQEIGQALVRFYQRFTFELDLEKSKLGDDGLPAMKGGIHLQFRGGLHFHVHERAPAAAAAGACEAACGAAAAAEPMAVA